MVVLSDGPWRRRLAADPAMVGRAVELEGESSGRSGGGVHTVVVVIPAGFVDAVLLAVAAAACPAWRASRVDPATTLRAEWTNTEGSTVRS